MRTKVLALALAAVTVGLAFLMAVLPPAAAQGTAGAPAKGEAAAPAKVVAPADGAPVGAWSPDAATAAYLAQLSPAARARSDAYYEGGYWIILWDLLVALVVAWLFLGTGLSARLRDLVERISRLRWVQTILYTAAYVVVVTVVTLPWDFYKGYVREHQYNMSNQALGAFLLDEGKMLLVLLVLGSVAAAVIYAVLRKAPRTWWLWGALVAIAFAMFTAAIAPVYLETFFNKFRPLPDGALKRTILSMAHANGIPATDVYQYDASKQTKRMSAHLSGLLGTTRISLNDNLLQRGSPEEIEAVVGHEMGHYVLHHEYKGMVFIAIMIVVGFAFLRWAFARLQASHGARWGIRDIGDVAGLPLLVVLFAVYMFVLTPIDNTTTRTMEAEADNYGLNMSRQPDGFAQAAMHLSEYRKMEPGTLEEIFFYDHPSGWHRIHRAMVWKGEHLHDTDIVAYDAGHPMVNGVPAPAPPAGGGR